MREEEEEWEEWEEWEEEWEEWEEEEEETWWEEEEVTDREELVGPDPDADVDEDEEEKEKCEFDMLKREWKWIDSKKGIQSKGDENRVFQVVVCEEEEEATREKWGRMVGIRSGWGWDGWRWRVEKRTAGGVTTETRLQAGCHFAGFILDRRLSKKNTRISKAHGDPFPMQKRKPNQNKKKTNQKNQTNQ